jgi:hypothetical protein
MLVSDPLVLPVAVDPLGAPASVVDAFGELGLVCATIVLHVTDKRAIPRKSACEKRRRANGRNEL